MTHKFFHMKKIYATLLAIAALSASQAQITVAGGMVPQYMQGNSTTNNNRVPVYFWLDITGLTPNATYRYYTTVDTAGSSPTSNGAGNPFLINMTSGTFRRSTSASLTNTNGHDSLTADGSGNYSGWFGVEPTGNGRFTPGTQVHPQLQLNNGAGGTSVATRLKALSYMMTVINFGTTSGDSLQGSALYDSASTFSVQPKDIVFLYDNINATGRPLSSCVVEDEGIAQAVITSTATFYRNDVDTFPQRWGTIIPNANSNGVRCVEYRSFSTGAAINTMTDNNGLWCSGANTIDPSNGTTGLYLDEYFTLLGTAIIPDTAYTGMGTSFGVSSNGPSGTQYSWDFGDGSPIDTNQNPAYTYIVPGTYTVTVIIQAPSCGISISDTIVVLLGTGIQTHGNNQPVLVSPNPSDGIFQLQLPGTASKRVTVINLLGETVFEQTTHQQTLPVDLHENAKGIYTVRVQSENGSCSTAKILLR